VFREGRRDESVHVGENWTFELVRLIPIMGVYEGLSPAW